jgi:hypothetical protein
LGQARAGLSTRITRTFFARSDSFATAKKFRLISEEKSNKEAAAKCIKTKMTGGRAWLQRGRFLPADFYRADTWEQGK